MTGTDKRMCDLVSHDSAFDSSRRWTDRYRGGQQQTVPHGFEYMIEKFPRSSLGSLV